MYEVKRGISVTKDFLEKIYAGFLGMNIGIRLGAPVEPEAWDFDRKGIRRDRRISEGL